LNQKKRLALDITGFFFRTSTQVKADVRSIARGIIVLIPPYIRMLSSDWLMKGVFFLPILRFFSSSTIAGIFA
jgi:hypothetical protein